MKTNTLPDAPDLAEIDGVTVLQALSDPVRLEIVRQLAGCTGDGELRCGQIEHIRFVNIVDICHQIPSFQLSGLGIPVRVFTVSSVICDDAPAQRSKSTVRPSTAVP